MPTVLRWNGYRFYFFSNEGAEPAHIHIDKAGCTAKFWLADSRLARNVGFSNREVAELSDKVREQSAAFQEAWLGYFGD
ncbi:MAG: DUF4160 domain-containing protein [Alphaproteobacteria bacterium]|nr:DUF4160 domain-containing protein [Alphaproteobacteria bacterium]MBU1514905.1 DUF4160 domain-containing protein [Alphaproteobacteria bacterium]MBU2093826.1 DUF4160 domain-containing protein [Alphaproteobacteria bacterium]MBU2154080.1 DUF4160 domain-containing protein [Alphaproteobacteria bacterium]MBU2305407.1 DUF4160 domain-containing protein [Alphaproteobacteria bacterium]